MHLHLVDAITAFAGSIPVTGTGLSPGPRRRASDDPGVMTIEAGSRRTASTGRPTDPEVLQSVREELEWAPGIDAGAITASVHEGVVHLEGQVRDLAEDVRVRKAVFRVRGAAGLVDRLTCDPGGVTDDVALLENAMHALGSAAGVPDGLRAAVHDGVVTLTGRALWHAEREAARHAVEHLTGVREVRNEIVLTARPPEADAEARIREALVRNAMLDADTIDVRMDGTEAILEGSVHSSAERQQAAIAVWSSPHVTQVHNRIHIVA